MNKVIKNAVNEVIDTYASGNIKGMGYQVRAEETELCKLAFKYRTDKCEKIKHPYTPFYFDLLNPQRSSIRKVLEIGIGLKRQGSHSDNTTGAGLHMWSDFFPRAQIYGADVDPRTMFREGKIKTVLCDQSKKEDLTHLVRMVGRDIDLLIDDGSHDPGDQVQTCLALMPLLKKEVIYIIEDVVDQGIEKRIREYDTRVISLRSSKGTRFPDDKLILVRNARSWS